MPLYEIPKWVIDVIKKKALDLSKLPQAKQKKKEEELSKLSPVEREKRKKKDFEKALTFLTEWGDFAVSEIPANTKPGDWVFCSNDDGGFGFHTKEEIIAGAEAINSKLDGDVDNAENND